jgi:enamine deaminase RidA (YjgF/YER057c/UK114 family)
MPGIKENLQALGITLAPLDRAGRSTIFCRRMDGLMFLSGQLSPNPLKVCTPQDISAAYEAGRQAAIRMLALLEDELGTLDRVDCFVKALCMVHSGADFSGMPAIANGHSDVIVAVFGERGCHARAAMGAHSLEKGAAILVDMAVKIRDEEAGI